MLLINSQGIRTGNNDRHIYIYITVGELLIDCNGIPQKRSFTEHALDWLFQVIDVVTVKLNTVTQLGETEG